MSTTILIGEGAAWDGPGAMGHVLIDLIVDNLRSGARNVRDRLLVGRETDIVDLTALTPDELRDVSSAMAAGLHSGGLRPAVQNELWLLLQSLEDDPRLAGAEARMSMGIFGGVRYRGDVGAAILDGWLDADASICPDLELPGASSEQWTASGRRSTWAYRRSPIGSELNISVWPGEGVVSAATLVEVFNRAVQIGDPIHAGVHVLTRLERDEARREGRPDLRLVGGNPSAPQVDVVRGLVAGVLYWRSFWSQSPLPRLGTAVVERTPTGGWIQLTPHPPNDATYPLFRRRRASLARALKQI
jgi:hypothetical protein